MRSLILAAVPLIAGLAKTSEELTALERFASQARTQVQSTETLISGEVKATFAIVILSDGAREARGLRIDLSSPDLQDRVYVEERLVPALKDSLAELKDGAGRFGCTGSCMFLPAMREGTHFLYPSQCGSDLVVNTGIASFRFPDTRATRFLSVMAQAVSAVQVTNPPNIR
jgi:hypothetical protein